MTWIYDWFSFPKEFSVICPNCKSECRGKDKPHTGKLYGDKGPKVITSVTYGSANALFVCSLSCLECGFQNDKLIYWPEDAYWKFNVKGEVLWAWSEEHAKEIFNFLKSKERKPFKFKFTAALLHIPTHFKLSKNRDGALKAIEKKLNENI